MKIVFANPPVFRWKNDSPRNDLRLINPRLALACSPYRGLRRISSFFIKHNKNVRFGVRAGSRWPWTMSTPLKKGAPYPFFMGYSAALLRSKGFNATIIDYVARNNVSYKQFIAEVKAENADIVVLECSTPTVDIDLWMAEEIARFTRVALAGPHITSNYEQMSQAYPFVTFWLKGEYIASSLKMAQTQTTGVYESEVIRDLDSIPFPFRDYNGGHNYYDPTMPTPEPQLQIYASKGCPFQCTFCLWPQTMYNRVTALREPGKILEEIKENVRQFGYKSIFFDDDTFNIGEDRISKLCDGLKDLGLPWTMMGRLDCSSSRLFDKMVSSGCVGMRFGIETFNLDVLKSIKKGIERVDFRQTLTYLAKNYTELMLHLTMMRDIPGQNEAIHTEDMQILKDLGFTTTDMRRSYQLSRCAPFPGTEMYNDLIKSGHGETLDDFSKYDGGQETVTKEVK